MAKPQSYGKLGVGTLTFGPDTRKYIDQVLRSRRLSYGPFTKKFEEQFSSLHGAKFGIMVNSGTSALRIAIAALKEIEKWHDGDEVILPAVTFVASANVILSQGLRPIFVDVDPRTYNINPQEIKRKINSRTRAIMPVHLFGQPAEMGPVLSLAKKYDLKIIEDSCETMFVKYKNRSVGSFGDIACFSTYVAHLIVTGVGGLAITRNKKYAEVLRSLANHGRDGIYTNISDAKGKKGSALKEVISRRFRFIRPGFSFRVTELEGAIGCAQIKIRNKILKKRKRNAEYLNAKLKPLDRFIQLPWHPAYSGHAFMMYPIVIRKGMGVKKEDFVNFLENRGVETRDMLPLINQPFYQKKFHIKQDSYPVADWINRYGFYIGCHQEMRKIELDYIVKTFFEYLKKHMHEKSFNYRH